MTREEFEARMGNTVTPEAWGGICELYFNSTDIAGWDAFIDDYKLHGTSKILACIWRRFQLKRDVEALNKFKVLAAAEKLLFIADDANDSDAYQKAVELVGIPYIAKFKIENGIRLNEAEKTYILEHLK